MSNSEVKQVVNIQAYIVGTVHKYQLKNGSTEEIQRFSEKLKQVVCDFGVKSIAEECNTEALELDRKRRKLPLDALQTTSVQDVALELSLPHRFCDPDLETRNELGIRQKSWFRANAFLCDQEISEEELNDKVKASFEKREHYWTEQLREFNTWPVLFVCGSNHVESFMLVLSAQGITGEVIEADWCA